MTKVKKAFCSLVAFILCITSLGIPISAVANTDDTSVCSVSEENHILFSKLFFDNHEDIEKLTEYFNDDAAMKTDFQSIETLDIDNIISELGLNTNTEETICILKNIFEINEYVEEEKIADATEGFFPLDHIGGLFSEEPTLNGVQPLWGAGVHRDDTTSLAKSYFSATVAEKIGKYNREVDIKYSSGWGAITGSANQYIHFNEYASGSDDSRDYAASVWFVACSLAWKNGNKEDAYMYLGYALHPLQDKEAHGQIGRGKSTPQHLVSYTKGDNITHADDKTGWEWTNSSRNALKAVSGSTKRFNAAKSVTIQYLEQYSKILK